jgi:hypothetical protein
MNEIESVQELYPLVKKYNAPIAATEGGVRFSRDEDERNDWFKTLPWDEDEFWSVFGCCSQDWYGAYVCDIEDTLYALERGWPTRGGY